MTIISKTIPEKYLYGQIFRWKTNEKNRVGEHVNFPLKTPIPNPIYMLIGGKKRIGKGN